MKKLHSLSIALASVICLSACSSDNAKETATDNATVTEETAIPTDSLYSQQEIEKRDRNYKILLEHIKIAPDSVSYIMDITEEEAIKLGVDKEYYQSTTEQIRATNEALKEAVERGDSVDLMDFKDLQIPE